MTTVDEQIFPTDYIDVVREISARVERLERSRPMIVGGIVAPDGTLVISSGITSSRTSAGVYEVTYQEPFVDQPILQLTIIDDTEAINIIADSPTPSSVTVMTFNSTVLIDGRFSIMAIRP
jgi:hypothetical protein